MAFTEDVPDTGSASGRVFFLFLTNIKVFTLVALAGLTFPCAAGEPPAHRPSLDTLVARASAYWELLVKGEKNRAMEYVQGPSKKNYLARQTPDFSDPRITDLELSSDPAVVWLTVKVRRVLPLIPTPLDWPVKERWVFEKGKWLVTIAEPSKPLDAYKATRTGRPAGIPESSPEDMEKKRQSINEALHFGNAKTDFGIVRQGQEVPIELSYWLAGNGSMVWRIKGDPRELVDRGSGSRELTPGEGQKIEMALQTQDYDGEVSQAFTLIVEHAGVEVPYEFSVHGFVYTPVSVSPRALRFLRGESSKEITLRNNSKSEARFVSFRNESGNLDVQPIPQTLAPGAECRLTVVLKDKPVTENLREELTLRLADPIDGMKKIVLPVVINYVRRENRWPDFPGVQPGELRTIPP